MLSCAQLLQFGEEIMEAGKTGDFYFEPPVKPLPVIA